MRLFEGISRWLPLFSGIIRLIFSAFRPLRKGEFMHNPPESCCRCPCHGSASEKGVDGNSRLSPPEAGGARLHPPVVGHEIILVQPLEHDESGLPEGLVDALPVEKHVGPLRDEGRPLREVYGAILHEYQQFLRSKPDGQALNEKEVIDEFLLNLRLKLIKAGNLVRDRSSL